MSVLLIDRLAIKEWHVYGLFDPVSGTVFYVGMTARPRSRIWGHFGSPNSPAWRRCRDLRESGVRPELRILATVSKYHQARYIEWRLLKEFFGRITNPTCVEPLCSAARYSDLPDENPDDPAIRVAWYHQQSEKKGM